MLCSFQPKELMKTLEYWRWWTFDLGGIKMAKTRHHMDEATALERHPEAKRVDGTMELLRVYEAGEKIPANFKPGLAPNNRR